VSRLAVTGRASTDGAPITPGTLLDGEHWVELDAGASVSLRHTLTSRELKLIGPGLVLPCRHGAEQILLARGQLSTASNLGVRPGAEVLIATPSAPSTTADAAIDVQFGPRGLRVRVKEGEAWLEPRDPAALPFQRTLAQPEGGRPAGGAKPTRAGLAGRVQGRAEVAAEAARRVLGAATAEPQASLGERAAAHIRRRTSARAACSMAAACDRFARDPAERQSLWLPSTHSDELWQSVPVPDLHKN